jgi:hypothetical protein
MVYIGIDLHRKRSQVAALDGNGELLFNRRVATRADELFNAIGEVGEEPVEVVFEATFGWGWLADMLAEAGIPDSHGASTGDQGHLLGWGQERLARITP